jgi:hypothetical protein
MVVWGVCCGEIGECGGCCRRWSSLAYLVSCMFRRVLEMDVKQLYVRSAVRCKCICDSYLPTPFITTRRSTKDWPNAAFPGRIVMQSRVQSDAGHTHSLLRRWKFLHDSPRKSVAILGRYSTTCSKLMRVLTFKLIRVSRKACMCLSCLVNFKSQLWAGR